MSTAPPAPVSGLTGYRRAVEDLAAACREAHAVAELLEYAAGLLRGRHPDPEGPSLDALPGGARVLAVLARRDRAFDAAERTWDGLDPRAREGVPAPGELLEDAGWA
jgi:hypothetical protein